MRTNFLLLERILSNDPRVSLDVDGTIAHIHKPMLDEINSRRHTQLTDADIKTYSSECLGISQTEFYEIYDLIWGERYNEIPLKVSADSVYSLCYHYDADFVTCRSRKLRKGLEDWLSFYLPSAFRVWRNVLPQDADKLNENYNLYIDDDPNLAERMKYHPDKFLILVDRPYNHGIDGENILRVANADVAIKKLIYHKNRPYTKTLLLLCLAFKLADNAASYLF